MELQLGADHPHTLAAKNNLADVWRCSGEHDKAVAAFSATLEHMEQALDADHPHILEAKSNLALVWMAKSEYALAEDLLGTVLAVQNRVLGSEHRDTLLARHNHTGAKLMLPENNKRALNDLLKVEEQVAAASRRLGLEELHARAVELVAVIRKAIKAKARRGRRH
eukprot:TRINITY_DN8380_c0_g1_i1.p2 TRINITY_DN8380_c0_g1~~TRINITY_DN8380_c0_g1_i1.p2  ORF type:complete len:166 (+),score=19.89 TRINITY_DN8380_c0_g1_i1:572-1069(+)